MDNFIGKLVAKAIKKFDSEILYYVNNKQNKPILEFHKVQEQIVKQVVLSVCNVALIESYKICSEISKGKLVCPKPIHCEECVLKYLKDQLQGK